MPSTYTTIAGDMWDTIAFKATGSGNRMDALMSANIQYRDIYVFPAGVTLNIPVLPEGETSDGLPPWKQ